MYPVSESFLAELEKSSISEGVEGSIYLTNGQSINFTGADIYNNTVEVRASAMDGNFSLGSATAKTLTIALIDKYPSPYAFKGATIFLKYWLQVGEEKEYIEFPRFYNAEVERQYNTIILTATDALSKLQNSYLDEGSGTLPDILSNLASLAGLYFSEDTLVLNDNVKSLTFQYSTDGEIKTPWDLLNYTCQLCGGFTSVRRHNGQDELFVCNGTNGGNAEVNYNFCTDTSISDFDVGFSRVAISFDGSTYTQSNSNPYSYSTLNLQSNPLLNSQSSNVYMILYYIAQGLQSVTYTPINQSYFGNPALEIGDRFTTNGKTALLTGYTWKFGGLQTLESASYTPETLSDTTRTDKVANVAKATAEKAKTTAEKAEIEIAEMKAEIATYKNNNEKTLIANAEKEVIRIAFTLAKAQNTLFWGNISANISSSGTAEVKYYLDDTAQATAPQTDVSAGKQIIPLHLPLDNVAEGNHVFSVKVKGVNGSVAKFQAVGSIFAQGIGKGDDPMSYCTAKIKIPANPTNAGRTLYLNCTSGLVDWGDGCKDYNGSGYHLYPVSAEEKQYTLKFKLWLPANGTADLKSRQLHFPHTGNITAPTEWQEIYFPNFGADYTDGVPNEIYFVNLLFSRLTKITIHEDLICDFTLQQAPNLEELKVSVNSKLKIPNTLKRLSVTYAKTPDATGYYNNLSYSLQSVEITSPAIIYAMFASNSSLTDVIMKNVESISEKAFSGCTSLTEITIPKSVKSIDKTAFQLSGLTTIKGVTGSYAQTFANENNFEFIAIEEE